MAKRLRLADRRDDGDRDAPRPRGARPRPERRRPRAGSFYELLRDAVRDRDRERRPDDRADGDERGGVGGARRAAPLAGVPVRAHEPRRGRRAPSSSSTRSTAATATGSSPSSAARRARPEHVLGRATTAPDRLRPVGQDHRARSGRIVQRDRTGLDSIGWMCDRPPVAKWYRPIVRPLAASRATEGDRSHCRPSPSVWGFVDESTILRRRRARRVARGRGHRSVRARTYGSGPRRTSSPSGSRSTRSRAGRTSSPPPTRQFQSQASGLRRSTSSTRPGATTCRSSTRRSRASNTPDVIEMGNTEMTKYMAAGAFANITLAQVLVRQLEQLARGPRRSRAIVQRQALRRPVLRGLARRHLPHRPLQEGRRSRRLRPASRQFTADGQEAREAEPQEGLLAGLHGGHRLVLRDELRLRLRRPDRRRSRTASGSARSTRRSRSPGLTAYKKFFSAASRASKTALDETDPPPYNVFSQGQAASIFGPGWFSCCVGKKYTKVDGAVRDAEPHVRARRCRASSAAPTSRSRAEPNDKALGSRLDRRLHEHGEREGPAGEGQHPERDEPARHSVNERAAAAELVRPDGEALGRRRERQHPPHDARADPHRAS